jgi:DNA-binding transcriptional MerR regulator
MSLNPDKNVRLYYSIKEVSEMLDVNITTLRFWEKEFPQLKPKVTAAKVRQYSEKDIALLRAIRSLVKVRGFKIAAARKYLMEDMHGAEDRAELLDTLISVREQLKELKASLGQLE